MPSGSTEHDLIYGGLEALRAAMPLGLCAYIHQETGGAPLLYMVSPRMEEIDPTEAFDLFTSLRSILDERTPRGHDTTIGGFTAVAVPTSGARSNGLHVAGRRNASLDERERDILERLARGIGKAIHALETTETGGTEGDGPIRVSVDLAEGQARAEVAIPLADEIRTGSGVAAHAGRAVVAAVIDAIDRTLTVAELTTVAVGNDRAALVLLADTLGHRALGSALLDESVDELQATATAGMRAALALAAKDDERERDVPGLPSDRTVH